MPKAVVHLERTKKQDSVLQDAEFKALGLILPEWARGSKLLDEFSITAATTVYIPHKLNRSHRGWILSRIVSASDDAGLIEIPKSDTDYKTAIADTHLQLRGNQDATCSVVVF